MTGMAREPATATTACDHVVNSLRDCKIGDDNCQCVKMSCLLDEIRLLAFPGVLAGCEIWVSIAGCGEKSAICCAAYDFSGMARRLTAISAPFFALSMLSGFGVASSLGSRR
jgi:hypothetical protein